MPSTEELNLAVEDDDIRASDDETHGSEDDFHSSNDNSPPATPTKKSGSPSKVVDSADEKKAVGKARGRKTKHPEITATGKGRGRPKKIAKLDGDQKVEKATIAKPKKKLSGKSRGRPRKVKNSDDESSDDKNDDEEEKRPVGRPSTGAVQLNILRTGRGQGRPSKAKAPKHFYVPTGKPRGRPKSQPAKDNGVKEENGKSAIESF